MQCSGLQVGAFLVLLAGTILIAISISTSSWSRRSLATLNVDSAVGADIVVERGLWQECQRTRGQIGEFESLRVDHDNCVNRYQDILEKVQHLQLGEAEKKIFEELKPWEVAVLALMCASGFFGILSLLFAPCCCNRCGCCLATFVFFAATLCAGGVCTYAYYASAGRTNFEKFTHKANEFGWSFWCAVAGGACQFLSGILFAVSRCRQHSYSHTI